MSDATPFIDTLSETQRRVLVALQSEFPLTEHPYADLGRRFHLSERQIYGFAEDLRNQGVIRRIGAIFVPHALGYVSTLAAARVPHPTDIDHVAAFINRFPEVTHNYERNSSFNIWFTIIAASQERLDRIIAEVQARNGVADVINMPATHTFKIRAVFGETDAPHTSAPVAAPHAFNRRERALVRTLQDDLGEGLTPYDHIHNQLPLVRQWMQAGVIRRMGAVLQHRRAGLSYNAMTVWNIPDDQIQAAGQVMATFPQVTHCYERPRQPQWPANLYGMVHGSTKRECETTAATIHQALTSASINVPKPQLLYSTREFKKNSMRYFQEPDCSR
jgi:DNA-binding Lrp family transcriptional regulator